MNNFRNSTMSTKDNSKETLGKNNEKNENSDNDKYITNFDDSLQEALNQIDKKEQIEDEQEKQRIDLIIQEQKLKNLENLQKFNNKNESEDTKIQDKNKNQLNLSQNSQNNQNDNSGNQEDIQEYIDKIYRNIERLNNNYKELEQQLTSSQNQQQKNQIAQALHPDEIEEEFKNDENDLNQDKKLKEHIKKYKNSNNYQNIYNLDNYHEFQQEQLQREKDIDNFLESQELLKQLHLKNRQYKQNKDLNEQFQKLDEELEKNLGSFEMEEQKSNIEKKSQILNSSYDPLNDSLMNRINEILEKKQDNNNEESKQNSDYINKEKKKNTYYNNINIRQNLDRFDNLNDTFDLLEKQKESCTNQIKHDYLPYNHHQIQDNEKYCIQDSFDSFQSRYKDKDEKEKTKKNNLNQNNIDNINYKDSDLKSNIDNSITTSQIIQFQDEEDNYSQNSIDNFISTPSQSSYSINNRQLADEFPDYENLTTSQQNEYLFQNNQEYSFINEICGENQNYNNVISNINLNGEENLNNSYYINQNQQLLQDENNINNNLHYNNDQNLSQNQYNSFEQDYNDDEDEEEEDEDDEENIENWGDEIEDSMDTNEQQEYYLMSLSQYQELSQNFLLNLEQQHQLNQIKGLTQEEIDQIELIQYKQNIQSGNDEKLKNEKQENQEKKQFIQCSICFDDYEENQFVRILECQHNFHKECVDDWLKQKSNCPLCRKDIAIKNVKGNKINEENDFISNTNNLQNIVEEQENNLSQEQE
ncbi:hypothetical protein PPERSA_02722 [Pseudocohnilembus persalinus]|uniref:RING-type domain-containing protein n=1 Tax=Pseudocohnilembus persalinus TaxID=266149 RepID=A0A0V0R681_PSEPJ|nr:hypothetical protein PPERSA_02722 [Pseudocohnilembus persalinus]|eukprot:KRX09850.1 hypothetical protein PPERSA_02722 [Pseudocohnilembus persalinus]